MAASIPFEEPKFPPVVSETNSADVKVSDVESGELKLERGLRSRHLQFIAIGGTIGTGLFLGTGPALATAGPVSLLLAFVVVALLVFSVMTSLCEMATYMPVTGSFTAYAARFVDPSLGFAMGWTYWFSWAVTFALELTAAGLIIQYWNSSLSIGIFIAVFWVVFTAVNFLPVRWYGELEMWFSSIKVLTILGWLIFAICVNTGAVGPQGYLGFRYWTAEPFRPYADIATGEGNDTTAKFVAFWSVLVTAGFSYQGSELVGIGAGEARDPSKSVPAAVRRTFWGIVALFVATVFFIGIVVPASDDAIVTGATDASASPLVRAAILANVPVLPDILNAVLLTAVLSAGNANVYSSSRVLVSLAQEGYAPRILAKTGADGVPRYAVAASSAVGLLAFMNLSSAGGTTVFSWLLNIVAIAGFTTWACLNIAHLRFMAALAAQNIARSTLPYAAPLQPFLAYFGLAFSILILLTNGFTVFLAWNTSDFFVAYVSVLLFLGLFIGHKLVCRTKPVKLAEVDLVTGRWE